MKIFLTIMTAIGVMCIIKGTYMFLTEQNAGMVESLDTILFVILFAVLFASWVYMFNRKA